MRVFEGEEVRDTSSFDPWRFRQGDAAKHARVILRINRWIIDPRAHASFFDVSPAVVNFGSGVIGTA